MYNPFLRASGCFALLLVAAVGGNSDQTNSPQKKLELGFNEVWRSIALGDEAGAINELKDTPELIKYQHPKSGSLLMAAAGWGRARVIKYLIVRGADPNASVHARTPLHVCLMVCTTGREFPENGFTPIDYLPAFDVLLRNGADPKKCEIAGGEPFAETGTRPTVLSEEPLLSLGVKLQTIGGPNTQARNALLARLREHMSLPVDAMSPLNAESLYTDLYRGKDLSSIRIPQN